MKRIIWIDVAKAIGIILVVIGHALTPKTYIHRIIYQFHMPLFFMISGYLFNESKINKLTFLKKVKSLYVPYISVNLIAIILLSFNTLNIKKIILVLLMVEKHDIFGATWFLASLFYISIMMYIIYSILISLKLEKNNYIYIIIIILFTMLGFLIPVKSHHIFVTLLGMAYYISGYLLKKINFIDKIINLKISKKIFIIIICFILLIIISPKNYVSFSKGIYASPVLTLISSISGCLLVIIISKLLSKNMFLNYIGKRSIDIMIWHFVAFKIVTLIQISIYKLDFSILKFHPYYDNSKIWVYVLIIFGIFIPLFISYIKEKLLLFIKKKVKPNEI